MFNALKYTQELERAGFSREQAEATVKLFIDVMNETFATKSDFKELELKLDASTFRLESAIREMDYKLTIKLGAMLTVAIGATATVIKLFQAFH